MKGKTQKSVFLILMALQLIFAAALLIRVCRMNMLPGGYIAAYVLLVAIVNIAMLAAVMISKKRNAVFLADAVCILLSLAMLCGSLALYKLDNTLQKISDSVPAEITRMAVVVLEENPAKAVTDISGYAVGYAEKDAAAKEMTEKLHEMLSPDADYSGYADVISLCNALLEKKEDAVILDEAYVDIISGLDGYEDFADRVRVLDTVGVETQVEETVADTEETAKPEQTPDTGEDIAPTKDLRRLSSDEESFIVYISGIDTFGSVNVRSRSDVNILAAVNTRTGHIQLINTPRDYYVTLPASGTVRDKLTHAGLYGVDNSEGALEQLYGIEIDYYVRMNFSGFEDIIDTLGGIDVYSAYEFTVEPVRHYTVGYNHLSGREALAFARERHAFASGDVQRGINQMEVVKAMISKLATVEFLYHYNEILEGLTDCFQTDIPSGLIYSMVKNQLSAQTSWQVDTYSVTGRGSHETTYSMPGVTAYVMIPDEEKVAEAKKLIEETLDGE